MQHMPKQLFRLFIARLAVVFLVSSLAMFAQQDPGSQIGTALNIMFTGTLATGLSIVGIVIAGCLMLFGGGQGIRILGAALLGCVLILDAPTIIGWIQTVV